MVKVATNSSCVVLKPSGAWNWTDAAQGLEITVEGSGPPIVAGGQPALMPNDILDAIAESAQGKGYHHVSAAKKAGRIGSVSPSLDSGTEASLITVSGEPVATVATSGSFVVVATEPSQIPGSPPTSDPIMTHEGVWFIKEAVQTVLSEKDGNSADGGVSVSSHAVAEAANQNGDVEEQPETKRRSPPTLRFKIDARALDVPFITAMLSDPSARLDIDVEAVQLHAKGGNVFGRRRWSVGWRKLFADDKAATPIEVTLPAAALEVDASLWLRIVATLKSPRAGVDAEELGDLAVFAPLGTHFSTIRPTVLPPPLTQPSAAADIWSDATRPLDDPDATRVVALCDAAEGKNGWLQIEDEPQIEAFDWRRIQHPIAVPLKLNPATEDQPERFAPIEFKLTPIAAPLLKLRVAMAQAESRLGELLNVLEGRRQEAALAATVRVAEIRHGEEIHDASAYVHAPKFIQGVSKRIGADIGVSAGSEISAARLFLLLYLNDLLAATEELRKLATPIFDLLADTEIDQAQSQMLARFGPAILVDPTAAARPEWLNGFSNEAMLLSWMGLAQRTLRSELSVLSEAIALGSTIFTTLTRVDSVVRRDAPLAVEPHMSVVDRSTLNCFEEHEDWRRVLDRRLADESATDIVDTLTRLRATTVALSVPTTLKQGGDKSIHWAIFGEIAKRGKNTIGWQTDLGDKEYKKLGEAMIKRATTRTLRVSLDVASLTEFSIAYGSSNARNRVLQAMGDVERIVLPEPMTDATVTVKMKRTTIARADIDYRVHVPQDAATAEIELITRGDTAFPEQASEFRETKRLRAKVDIGLGSLVVLWGAYDLHKRIHDWERNDKVENSAQIVSTLIEMTSAVGGAIVASKRTGLTRLAVSGLGTALTKLAYLGAAVDGAIAVYSTVGYLARGEGMNALVSSGHGAAVITMSLAAAGLISPLTWPIMIGLFVTSISAPMLISPSAEEKDREALFERLRAIVRASDFGAHGAAATIADQKRMLRARASGDSALTEEAWLSDFSNLPAIDAEGQQSRIIAVMIALAARVEHATASMTMPEDDTWIGDRQACYVNFGWEVLVLVNPEFRFHTGGLSNDEYVAIEVNEQDGARRAVVDANGVLATQPLTATPWRSNSKELKGLVLIDPGLCREPPIVGSLECLLNGPLLASFEMLFVLGNALGRSPRSLPPRLSLPDGDGGWLHLRASQVGSTAFRLNRNTEGDII